MISKHVGVGQVGPFRPHALARCHTPMSLTTGSSSPTTASRSQVCMGESIQLERDEPPCEPSGFPCPAS
jgi:hypothetical protein